MQLKKRLNNYHLRKTDFMLFWIALTLLLLAVLWVRFAPSDPNTWHVDPETVVKSRRPNQFLMRDGADVDSLVFDENPAQFAARFHDFAMSKPGMTKLAGEPEALWMTYIQRTKRMAYPDYISVKIAPTDNGSARLMIYSRSRFGHSDLGVNKARITRWAAALGQPIAR